jgi:hypothetical protein
VGDDRRVVDYFLLSRDFRSIWTHPSPLSFFGQAGAFQPSLWAYRHPVDIDRVLNEAAADTIRDYRADYNNRPSTSICFMTAVASTSDRLNCELRRILFFAGSSANRPLFCCFELFLHKQTRILPVTNATLLFTPSSNLRSATYSQTSRLLSSSLSLGIPFPRST